MDPNTQTPAEDDPKPQAAPELNGPEISDEDLQSLSQGERDELLRMAAEDKAAEEEAARAAQPEPEPEPDPAAQQPEPERPEIPDTTDAKKRIDAAKQEIANLRTQYDDGELTEAQWQEQFDSANDRLADARADVKAAERIEQETLAEDERRWGAAVKDFQKRAPALFDRNPVEKLGGASIYEAFDQIVRNVTADPMNATMPFEDQLGLAHERLQGWAKRAGVDLPEVVSAEPAPAETEKLEVRKDSRPEPPATLAGIPQSDTQNGADGRFAGLDRLVQGDDPYAAERALETMTDAEQMAYLRGA